MTKIITVGIGDLAASRDPGVVIKTIGLGSCIAVVMLDPVTKAIGMVHVALPDSSIDRIKAMGQPGYFADTGVPALLMKMAELGCDARGRGFIVKLTGGANILDASEVFNIGKRNLLSCRKVVWQLKLAVAAEDAGGDISRTVYVHQDTGKTEINCPTRGNWEI